MHISRMVERFCNGIGKRRWYRAENVLNTCRFRWSLTWRQRTDLKTPGHLVGEKSKESGYEMRFYPGGRNRSTIALSANSSRLVLPPIYRP